MLNIPLFILSLRIEQKGMHLNHDYYQVVGNQCRKENAYTGHQYNIFLYIN